MSRSTKAKCGCRVSILTDYRGDIQEVTIDNPCPEHGRGDAIISRFENVAETLRQRIVGLEVSVGDLQAIVRSLSR